jgi:hypothetical protein
MRSQILGLTLVLFVGAACASQDPVTPSAAGAAAANRSATVTSNAGVSATTDNRAEQVVFSGQVPPGTFTGTGAEDIDFWVWCEHGGADNPYAGECVGSMGVDALTQAVSGRVHMVPDANPGLGMDHVIDVQSKNGSLACELRNHLPLSHGPTSTVDVACTAPGTITGSFSGAVVITTESPMS